MKLIYIEWHDAFASGGWYDKDQLDNWKQGDWIVKQVGWLYEETNKQIILASRYSPPDQDGIEQYGQLQKIPKTWIRKRIDLSKYVKLQTNKANQSKSI